MFNYSLVVFKTNSSSMEFYTCISNGDFFRILFQKFYFKFIHSYIFHVCWGFISWISQWLNEQGDFALVALGTILLSSMLLAPEGLIVKVTKIFPLKLIK